jgi:uncharacterized Fe-S center protein
MPNNNKKSTVYYLDMRKKQNVSLVERLGNCLDKSKLLLDVNSRDKVAIKLHFGERGNFSYIRPPFLHRIVDEVKKKEGMPFLTDSNTLYHHKRDNAIDHIITAAINGFSYETVGCPIIISDGLIGRDFETVQIDGKHFKDVYISSAIYHADFLIVATHITAHPVAGIGGSIKNLAMGGASSKGKFQQHSEFIPGLTEDKCKLCGKCIEACGYDAIKKGEKHIIFIEENCVGCGECVSVCRYGALQPKFEKQVRKLQEKMIEYILGIKKTKDNKIVYINFLLDIMPHCDCHDKSSIPFVSDLGILLSDDPIAVDIAAVDLINSVPFNPVSEFSNRDEKKDKIKTIGNGIEWKWQFDYGDKIGIGKKDYEIINM